MIRWKKNTICQIFHQIKFRKFWWKLTKWRMFFFFFFFLIQLILHNTQFWLYLAPPIGYTLNLKALIKVSKNSWTSQLSYRVLHLKENPKFISLKKHLPKAPLQGKMQRLMLKIWKYTTGLCSANLQSVESNAGLHWSFSSLAIGEFGQKTDCIKSSILIPLMENCQ